MNLTLACSQSDFVRNHVNIIPASVKDIFEKSNLLTILVPTSAVKVVSVHNVLSLQYTKIKRCV